MGQRLLLHGRTYGMSDIDTSITNNDGNSYTNTTTSSYACSHCEGSGRRWVVGTPHSSGRVICSRCNGTGQIILRMAIISSTASTTDNSVYNNNTSKYSW
jgi:DnaJ-class molecular chaperone